VGIVRLTPLGTALERVLQGLRNEYKEVEVIRWVVMPDHLHVVVQVHQVVSRHLWPEQPLSNRPNKGRFELMNAMCRVLCGLLP
jgi:REP element-mobilizing transposase RayT